MCLHWTICCRHFCRWIYERHQRVPSPNGTMIRFVCVRASMQQVPIHSLFYLHHPYISELRFTFSFCYTVWNELRDCTEFSDNIQWFVEGQCKYPRLSVNYLFHFRKLKCAFFLHLQLVYWKYNNWNEKIENHLNMNGRVTHVDHLFCWCFFSRIYSMQLIICSKNNAHSFHRATNTSISVL